MHTHPKDLPTGDQERYYLTAKTKETKTTVIDNNARSSMGARIHLVLKIEGATALRVKLKDRSVHFGDNTWDKLPYPAHAFCARDGITLTLPVEPATSMTINRNDYGEVKVSTELSDVAASPAFIVKTGLRKWIYLNVVPLENFAERNYIQC